MSKLTQEHMSKRNKRFKYASSDLETCGMASVVDQKDDSRSREPRLRLAVAK